MRVQAGGRAGQRRARRGGAAAGRGGSDLVPGGAKGWGTKGQDTAHRAGGASLARGHGVVSRGAGGGCVVSQGSLRGVPGVTACVLDSPGVLTQGSETRVTSDEHLGPGWQWGQREAGCGIGGPGTPAGPSPPRTFRGGAEQDRGGLGPSPQPRPVGGPGGGLGAWEGTVGSPCSEGRAQGCASPPRTPLSAVSCAPWRPAGRGLHRAVGKGQRAGARGRGRAGGGERGHHGSGAPPGGPRQLRGWLLPAVRGGPAPWMGGLRLGEATSPAPGHGQERAELGSESGRPTRGPPHRTYGPHCSRWVTTLELR